MDYLYVLFALGAVGFVFAGLKTVGDGNRKSMTRLKL
jgi:hypothetical protein